MQEIENPTKPKRDTVVVSYRLDRRAKAALLQMAIEADLSPRTWLEKNILQFAETRVVAKRREHPDLRALLFQVGRAGNNLNQLAYKFNHLDKLGKLDGRHFDDAVERLDEISTLLRIALARAQ